MTLRKRKSASSPKQSPSANQVKAKMGSPKKVRRKTAAKRDAKETGEEKDFERKRKRGTRSDDFSDGEDGKGVSDEDTKWADAVKKNLPGSDLARYAKQAVTRKIGGVAIPKPKEVREAKEAVVSKQAQDGRHLAGIMAEETEGVTTNDRSGESNKDKEEHGADEEVSKEDEVLEDTTESGLKGNGESTIEAAAPTTPSDEQSGEGSVGKEGEEKREADIEAEAERRKRMEQERKDAEAEAGKQRKERVKRLAKERAAEEKEALEKAEKKLRREEEEEKSINFKVARELDEIETMAAGKWEEMVWLREKHPRGKMKGRDFNFLLGRLHGAIIEEVDGFSVNRGKMEQILQEFVSMNKKNQELLKFTEPERKQKCMEIMGASIVDLLGGGYRKKYLVQKVDEDAEVRAAQGRTSAGAESDKNLSRKGDENRQQLGRDNAPEAPMSGREVRMAIAARAAEEGIRVLHNLHGGEQQLAQVATLERVVNEGPLSGTQLMEGMVTSTWLNEMGCEVVDLGTKCGIMEAFAKGILKVRNTKAGVDLVRKRMLKVIEMEGDGPCYIYLAGKHVMDLASVRGGNAISKMQSDLEKGEDLYEMEGVVAMANALNTNMVYVEVLRGEVVVAEVGLEGVGWENAVLCVRVGDSFACTPTRGLWRTNRADKEGQDNTMRDGPKSGSEGLGSSDTRAKDVGSAERMTRAEARVEAAASSTTKSHAERNKEVSVRLEGVRKAGQPWAPPNVKDGSIPPAGQDIAARHAQGKRSKEPLSAPMPPAKVKRMQTQGTKERDQAGGTSQAGDVNGKPIRLMSLEVKELNQLRDRAESGHSKAGGQSQLAKPKRSLGEGSKVSIKATTGRIGKHLSIEVNEDSSDLIGLEALKTIDSAMRSLGHKLHYYNKEQLVCAVVGAVHNRTTPGTGERVDQEVQLMAIPQMLPGETIVSTGDVIVSQVCRSGNVMHMVEKRGSSSARAANRTKVTAEILCDGSWDNSFPSFEADCAPRVGQLVPSFHYENRFRYANHDEHERVWDSINKKDFRPGEPFASQILEEVNLSYEFTKNAILPIMGDVVGGVLKRMEKEESHEIKDTLIFMECDAKRCMTSRVANEMEQQLSFPGVKSVLWHNYSRLAYMRKTGQHAEGDMYELLAHCCESIEEAGTDTLGTSSGGDMRVLHGWVPLVQGSDSLDECVQNQGGRVFAAVLAMPVSVPNFKLKGLQLELVIVVGKGGLKVIVPGKEKRLANGDIKILCFVKTSVASKKRKKAEGDSDTEQDGSDHENRREDAQGRDAMGGEGGDRKGADRKERNERWGDQRTKSSGGTCQGGRFGSAWGTQESDGEQRIQGPGKIQQGESLGSAWGLQSGEQDNDLNLVRRERQAWEEMPVHLANRDEDSMEVDSRMQGNEGGWSTEKIRVCSEDVVKSAQQIEEAMDDGSELYREMVDNNATDSMNIELRKQNVSQLEEMKRKVMDQVRGKGLESTTMLKLLGEARTVRSGLAANYDGSEGCELAIKRMDDKIDRLDEAWFASVRQARELELECERVGREIGLEMGMIKMLVALIAGRKRAFRMTGEWKEWQEKAVRSRIAPLYEEEEPASVHVTREAPGASEEFVIRRPSNITCGKAEEVRNGSGNDASVGVKVTEDEWVEGDKGEAEQRSRLMQEKWERLQVVLWRQTLEKNGKAGREEAQQSGRDQQGGDLQAGVSAAEYAHQGGELMETHAAKECVVGQVVLRNEVVEAGNDEEKQAMPYSSRATRDLEMGGAFGQASITPMVVHATVDEEGRATTSNLISALEIQQQLNCPRCVAMEAAKEGFNDLDEAVAYAYHLDQMRLYAVSEHANLSRGDDREENRQEDEGDEEGPLPIVSFASTNYSFLSEDDRRTLSAAAVGLESRAGKTLDWRNGEELYNATIEAVWQGCDMPEGDEQHMWFMARPSDSLGEVIVEEGVTELLGACRDGLTVFGVEEFGDFEGEPVYVNDIIAEVTLDHERVTQKPSFLRRAHRRAGKLMQAMYMEDEADICAQFAKDFFIPLLDRLNKWLIQRIADTELQALYELSEVVIADVNAIRSITRRVAKDYLALGEFGHPLSPPIEWRDFSRYAYIRKEEEVGTLGGEYEVLADDINGINGRMSQQNSGLRDDAMIIFHAWVSETTSPCLIQNLMDRQGCCMAGVFVTLKRKGNWTLNGYELIGEITLENVAAFVMGNEGQPIKAPLKILTYVADEYLSPPSNPRVAVAARSEEQPPTWPGISHDLEARDSIRAEDNSEEVVSNSDYQEGEPSLGWNQASVMGEVGSMGVWCDAVENWGPWNHIMWTVSSEWSIVAPTPLTGNRKRALIASLASIWSAIGLWEVAREQIRLVKNDILAVGKVRGVELIDKRRLQSVYSTNTTASRACVCTNGTGALMIVMSLEEARACIADLVEDMGSQSWNDFGVALYLREWKDVCLWGGSARQRRRGVES